MQILPICVLFLTKSISNKQLRKLLVQRDNFNKLKILFGHDLLLMMNTNNFEFKSIWKNIFKFKRKIYFLWKYRNLYRINSRDGHDSKSRVMGKTMSKQTECMNTKPKSKNSEGNSKIRKMRYFTVFWNFRKIFSKK